MLYRTEYPDLDTPFRSEISSGSDSEEVDDNHDVEGNNWEAMAEQVTFDTDSEDDNISKSTKIDTV
jgi:hypothetical protein